MNIVYSGNNVTWSSIEKDIPYTKVVWSMGSDGIPIFILINENNQVK